MYTKQYSKDDIEKISKFSQYRGIKIHVGLPCLPILSETEKKENPLLDVIFALDPVTKIPRGDISMYLSDKTSPEVRAYIQQNLMYEMPISDGVPDGVDITPYIREKGETEFEYANRLQEMMLKEINEQKALQEIDNRVTPKVE